MAVTLNHSKDFSDHKHFYKSFLRLRFIAVFMLLSHMVALAIGGTAHMWFLATLCIGASIVATILGGAVEQLGWKPGVAISAPLLLMLLVVSV